MGWNIAGTAPLRRKANVTSPPQPSKNFIATGTVKRHPDGFGFLIPDTPGIPHVYISRHAMFGIMANDSLKVRATLEEPPDRYRGEVVEVIQRAVRDVIGKFHAKRDGSGTLKDEESNWGSELIIASGSTKGAQDGDLVEARITRYPDDQGKIYAEVREVLPKGTDALYDTKRVIFANRIPYEFSAKALNQAKTFPHEVQQEEIRYRKDLRNLDLITIDGATAKDFDDAIYVEKLERGYRCWVGIADVSHYVAENSPIDQDAYVRGTSVYFPHHVVPMLPEELSNELCSLKPNVPRLSLVCEMQIDSQGEIRDFKFYEAVIQSKARVTYGQAQEVLDGEDPGPLQPVAEMIKTAAGLAKILLARRLEQGSLDLEIPETQVILDESGNPTDILKSERLFAHRLIEEFMLAANICAARFIDRSQVPGMFRIHENPAPDNLQTLSNFLAVFGFEKDLHGGKLQKKIGRALESFRGQPQAEVLNILTLRSMKQARYSHENIGHFGLGFSHYSHFTSPIRRYPDLIVHRIIKSLILKSEQYRRYTEDELATSGVHLSACEQRATKSERQFNSIKRSRFMSQYIGQEFDGFISGVAKFGIFVALRQFDVDGLVKIDQLPGHGYEFDEDRLVLSARNSGHSFQIGDPARVRVVNTNPEQGQIDFALSEVNQLGTHQDRQTHRTDHQERGKAADDRRRARQSRISKRRRKG